jgi:4-amino-4-deoxy-L-arabinose transferase-like glycosyltransferase
MVFLITRLLNISSLNVNSDEIRHILRAQATLEGNLFIGMQESLKQFYIWLVAIGIYFFDDQLFVARTISALSGLITGLTCYQLGLLLYQNRFIGGLAALFYLVSPYALFFDRLALTDSLLTMLIAISILLSVKLWQQPTIIRAVLLGIILGCAVLTKLYATIFYITPLLLWMILGRTINWQRIGQLLLVTYTTTLPAWLPVLLIGKQAYQEDHYQKIITTSSSMETSITFLHNLQLMASWFATYLTWPFIILLSFTLLVTVISDKRKPSLLLLSLVVIYLLTFAFLIDMLVSRYLLPVIVPLVLLLAWGMWQMLNFVYSKNWGILNRYTKIILTTTFLVGLCWPALSFDYLIITNPTQAPLPLVDSWSFGQNQAADAYRQAAMFIAELTEQYPQMVVLRGQTRLNFYHQLNGIVTFFVPNSVREHVSFVEVPQFDSQIPEAIFNDYARQSPTFLVITTRIESDELLSYNDILIKATDYPQAWKLASFPQPDGNWKVEVYQWLSPSEFDERRFQQGGNTNLE